MAGFANLAAVRTALDAGKFFRQGFVKDQNDNNFATAHWSNYWFVDGMPTLGGDPGASPGTTYTNDAASIHFPARAGANKYIAELSLTGTGFSTARQIYTVVLYDRLAAVGSVSVASSGDKTVNSQALPRYADGFGVQAWVECGSAGSGNFTLSLKSYTNELGVAGQAGPSVTVPLSSSGFFPRRLSTMPIQAGDLGVRSVETVNISSAAASGTINIVLLKPIIALSFLCLPAAGTSTSSTQDFILDRASFPRIYDGASLAFMACGGTARITLRGEILVVYS